MRDAATGPQRRPRAWLPPRAPCHGSCIVAQCCTMAFMLVKGCGVGTQIAMYSCIGAGLFCLLCYRFKKCYACGAPRPQGGGTGLSITRMGGWRGQSAPSLLSKPRGV